MTSLQNENICAYLEKSDGTRSVVAIVPDLISVLDSQSGDNIGSQDYAYGLRVTGEYFSCLQSHDRNNNCRSCSHCSCWRSEVDD